MKKTVEKKQRNLTEAKFGTLKNYCTDQEKKRPKVLKSLTKKEGGNITDLTEIKMFVNK